MLTFRFLISKHLFCLTKSFLRDKLLKNLLLLCMHVYAHDGYVGKQATLGSWFSPFNFMWVLEFELRSPGLYWRCLYPKGHWTKSLFFLSICVITKGKLCFWLCSILILTLFSLKTKPVGGGTKVVVCSEYDQRILYTYIKISKWNTLFYMINNANLKGNNTVCFWFLHFQNTVIYFFIHFEIRSHYDAQSDVVILPLP